MHRDSKEKKTETMKSGTLMSRGLFMFLAAAEHAQYFQVSSLNLLCVQFSSCSFNNNNLYYLLRWDYDIDEINITNETDRKWRDVHFLLTHSKAKRFWKNHHQQLLPELWLTDWMVQKKKKNFVYDFQRFPSRPTN